MSEIFNAMAAKYDTPERIALAPISQPKPFEPYFKRQPASNSDRYRRRYRPSKSALSSLCPALSHLGYCP